MCMIGILPNQLKTLLNSQNQTTANIAFEDRSKEIFWQIYIFGKQGKDIYQSFGGILSQKIGNPIKKK